MIEEYIPSIHFVQYRVNGEPELRYAIPKDDWWNLPFGTRTGYAVIDVWVYDLAGNSVHGTYWFWLDEGVVKSIQPVCDGKYRVRQIPAKTLSWIPNEYTAVAMKPNTMLIPIPGDIYRVIKINDQNPSRSCRYGVIFSK